MGSQFALSVTRRLRVLSAVVEIGAHFPAWHESKIRLFLHALRKQHGYSTAQAAKELGYSTSSLNAWERGYLAPSFVQLTEWASMFDMQVLLTPRVANSQLSGPEHDLRATIVAEQRAL